METATNTQNVSHETFERISEAAEELLAALKALNPETGRLPTFSSPRPRGWEWGVARPWGDVTIGNAAHYVNALILAGAWEDALREEQAELDEMLGETAE